MSYNNNTNIVEFSTTPITPESKTTLYPYTTNQFYQTIDPTIREYLLTSFLPPDYDLPYNIYEWNVTEIIHYINVADPNLLYEMDTAYLVAIFPDYFLGQLPRDILIAHKLYYLLPSNDPYFTNSTNLNLTIESCQGIFVDTKYKTYFNFEFGNETTKCALRCEYSTILWGHTDDELSSISSFFLIMSMLYLILVIIIWTNIIFDIKYSKEKCINRPFLFHAPICMVINYSIVALCILLPIILGQDNFVCANDKDNIKTVTTHNPNGSILCTLSGCLFYSSEMLVGIYTAAFSISLWKQFYAPLNSVYAELKSKTYCKCCCKFVNIFCTKCPCISICKMVCKDDIESIQLSKQQSASVMGSISKSVHTMRSVMRSERHNKKYKVTCGDIFCSKTSMIHYFLYFIVISFMIYALFNHSYDGFSPLGMCSIGNSSLLTLLMIPYSIIMSISILFIPPAIYLLIRIVIKNASTSSSAFKNLGWRLLVFFFFLEIAWGCIVAISYYC